MRILVLVQSTELPVYADLIQTQMETWDSIKHPDIDVVYYKASAKFDVLEGNVLSITNRDHITKVFSTLMRSIRHLRNSEWDYVVKTDNSVYLNKQRLYDLVASKPREKYYGGKVITTNIHISDGTVIPQSFIWGECIIMSRDIAMYLVDKFNRAPLKGWLAEDIVISQILDGYCSWDDSIPINYITSEDSINTEAVIYRVRLAALEVGPMFELPPNMSDIIGSDIKIMKLIHNTLTNGQANNHSILQEQTKD